MRSISAAVALVTLLSACSPAATRSSPRHWRTDTRILTGADLDHPSARNAFDLIRILRPQFLQFGGTASHNERVIYIDGLRAGGARDLRLIPADAVHEIRFLTGPEANFRYGLDHSAGAIVVTTLIRAPYTCPGCR